MTLIAAFAVTLTTGTEAFANEPGEGNTWNTEISDSTPIQSADTLSEATGASGTYVAIWRGWDNNNVWIAVNHNNSFSVPNASGAPVETNVAPRVIYSNGWFYAFYTGTDGHILWIRVQDTFTGNAPLAALPSHWSSWQIITGNTTTQSVSLASVPGAGLMMVYGSATDANMWSAWLPNGFVIFNTAVRINDPNRIQGGSFISINAPTVTFNPVAQTFYAAYRGIDNRVWLASQSLGTSTWHDEGNIGSPNGGGIVDSPVIAAFPNGNMLIDALASDNTLWQNTQRLVGGSWQITGWQQESQHWGSNVVPSISIVNGFAYLLLTGYNSYVYWKPGYNGS